MDKTTNKEKISYKFIIKEIIVYVLLGIWALIVLLPFYWMIMTSFKTNASYNAEMTPQFIPLSPTFDNYAIAWTAVPLARYMLNTVVFSITTTFLMIIVSILAAFAFARLEFKGKNLLVSGGVAYNQAIINYLKQEYDQVICLDEPQFNGAIGCAYYGNMKQ